MIPFAGSHCAWRVRISVSADFPIKLRGIKTHGAPHTAWQLLEHLAHRVFSRNPDYKEMKFPDQLPGRRPKPRPKLPRWDKSPEVRRRPPSPTPLRISTPASASTRLDPAARSVTGWPTTTCNHTLGQLVFVRKYADQGGFSKVDKYRGGCGERGVWCYFASSIFRTKTTVPSGRSCGRPPVTLRAAASVRCRAECGR